MAGGRGGGRGKRKERRKKGRDREKEGKGKEGENKTELHNARSSTYIFLCVHLKLALYQVKMKRNVCANNFKFNFSLLKVSAVYKTLISYQDMHKM